MRSVPYYPGCALRERSQHLDRSARDSAERLGFRLEELSSWTCCGAVPPVSSERVMNLVPSARILKSVRDRGEKELVTICDFCYNTLKRTNNWLGDETVRRRVNSYLRTEDPERAYLTAPEEEWVDYECDVRVLHLMEYLRDVVGYDGVADRVSRSLAGLRLAPYYGCVMLRPGPEIGLDDPDDPSIIEGLIESLGAEAVEHPFRTECCGSYLSVSRPDASERLCGRIVASASDRGADALVVSCPLCFYNLDSSQESEEGGGLPVLYFTQLLSLALGGSPDEQGFERHRTDVSPVLRKAGLSGEEVAS